MQHSPSKQFGFTLVELAIVLMIIGLLIGGILRGQELMNNARTQNIIKMVNSYQGAVVTFKDTYSADPGDFSKASSRISGCQAGNTNSCQNGDGNGAIGTPIEPWLGGQQQATTENTQFWKHLALSHLISGVDPSFTGSQAIFGKSHPASPIPGGFTVVTVGTVGAECSGAAAGTGQCIYGTLMLRLHGDPNGAQIETNPVLTPKQASYIDRKMDDGIPLTGSVTGAGLGYEPACEGPTYNESREEKLCVLLFAMNR